MVRIAVVLVGVGLWLAAWGAFPAGPEVGGIAAGAPLATTPSPTATPTRTVTPTYVVITSTPTPPNAATVLAQLAALATQIALEGTPTPLPRNWVTPIVVTATPTPPNVWTATPTPTLVVITPSPTAANVATAFARLAALATQAAREGTPTPLPRNWVTPVVVTATPTPANPATAAWLTVTAFVVALTGTPTPTPPNVWTATPTPTLVVITPSPTAANVATAFARLAARATQIALQGTPTPLPPNWVTPVVVTAVPTPANPATAAWATLIAALDGTPTPTPLNVWTATPTPTYVIVTPTPEPGNLATAIALATQVARAGTPTPLPPNWVTPIVVTATPTPANAATAEYLALRAVLAALAGTPTPTPLHMWTATPTPLIWVDVPVLPTATPQRTISTPDPFLVPPEFYGRIGFVSDREGGRPAWYIMDPDGSNVQRLSGPDIYYAALVRDTIDPSGEYQVIVTEPRTPQYDRQVGKNTELSIVRLADGYQWYIIGQTRGADYFPAYCPAEPRYIAYTSQQSGNDEIFVVDLLSGDREGAVLTTTRLTENEWQWDKHPSWSPDCRQIVFYSNRDGRNQIYVMDFMGMNYPGGNQHNISNNPYNDWDPVWFKPPPARRVP
jgi:hypothetical protein